LGSQLDDRAKLTEFFGGEIQLEDPETKNWWRSVHNTLPWPRSVRRIIHRVTKAGAG
jgi:hypothetical protein